MIVTWIQIVKAVLGLSAAGLFILWVRHAGSKRIAEQQRQKLAEGKPERAKQVKQRAAG